MENPKQQLIVQPPSYSELLERAYQAVENGDGIEIKLASGVWTKVIINAVQDGNVGGGYYIFGQKQGIIEMSPSTEDSNDPAKAKLFPA